MYDVVVVGAGLSGLASAYELIQRDATLSVKVLEANDRLGGRLLSTKLKCATGGSETWDLGGQWVGRTQTYISSLLKELDIGVYRQHLDGKKYLQVGAGNKITHYESTLPSMSFLDAIQLARVLNQIDNLTKRVDSIDPAKSQDAQLFDSITVEEYLKTITTSKAVHDCMQAAFGTIFGVTLNKVSLLFCLLYASAAGSLANVLEGTENGGQEFKIKGGSQNICERLADKIGRENIQLGSPIIAADQTNGTTVRLTTLVKGSSEIVEAKRVIFAIPPNMLGRINFLPKLPSSKSEVFKRMPMGFLIKFLATYEKAFWREAGYSGEIVSNGSLTADGFHGPLSLVMDCTISDGKNPALVGFISAEQGVSWSERSSDSRRQAVLTQLSHFFGSEALRPLEYIEKDWSSEPWVGGCPTCSCTPGSMTYFSSALRQPTGRFHFGATESATKWCGFMDGAVQSGQRAAIEVLHAFQPSLVASTELAEYGCYGYARIAAPKKREFFVKKRYLVLLGLTAVGVVAGILHFRSK